MEHVAAIITITPVVTAMDGAPVWALDGPCTGPGRTLHMLRMEEYTIIHLRDATDRLMRDQNLLLLFVFCALLR